MHMTTLTCLSGEQQQQALAWARHIDAVGGRLYLVGGAVRDALRGVPSGDADFCVTGLRAQQVPALVPGAFLTGKAFPVFRAPLCDVFAEVALARTEVKTQEGHTGFAVDAAPQVRIEDDLRRRDLTQNAMAVDVLTGCLIDPFGGEADLKERCLRAVSPAFGEDPLRVYRTARFAAQLQMTVEPGTLALMTSLRGELSALSAERVLAELRKGLLSDRPSLFFETLQQARVLDVHFPELSALIEVPQPVRYHPEGDAFAHTMQVLDVTADRGREVEVRYAALVHDYGKGVTPPSGWPSHFGHEKLGVPLAREQGRRLKVPSAWQRGALFATEYHMLLHRWRQLRAGTLIDLYAKARRQPLGVKGFAFVCEADWCGRNRMDQTCVETQEWLELWDQLEANVRGGDVRTRVHSEQEGKALGEQIRRARIAYVKAWLAERPHIPT